MSALEDYSPSRVKTDQAFVDRFSTSGLLDLALA
jgi:hypothetical protein